MTRSATNHFQLAASYATRQAGACLVVMTGPSGTGKSTVGATVAARAGAAYISSDTVRKALAGIPPHERAGAAFGEGLYTPEMTRRTYDEIRARAAEHLGRGRPVVLDAVHATRAEREASVAVARATGVPFLVAALTIPGDTALTRIASRRTDPVATSDATEAIYQQQVQAYEEVDEDALVRVLCAP
jgi:uncharacterized protein